MTQHNVEVVGTILRFRTTLEHECGVSKWQEVVPMAEGGENADKGGKLKSGIPSFLFGYDSGKGVLFQICFEFKICSLQDFES